MVYVTDTIPWNCVYCTERIQKKLWTHTLIIGVIIVFLQMLKV